MMRRQNVASLQQVDYVAIVEEATPFECVRVIKPTSSPRGRPTRNGTGRYTKGIYEEGKEFLFGKSIILETQGFSFSSSISSTTSSTYTPTRQKRSCRIFRSTYSFEGS
jgi:hypothetical protein